MNRLLTLLATIALLASNGLAQQDVDPPPLRAEVAPPNALINDVEQATVATHAATPFIEESTFVIIDIDITQVDVEKTGGWLLSMVGPDGQGPPQQLITMIRGIVETLKSSGVKHLFLTGSTRSILDGGPLLIIPCQKVDAVKAVASMLLENAPIDPPAKVHAGEDVVLVGPQAIIDRVSNGEGTARADLILPLEDDNRLDHSMVLSLPAEASVELAQLWPDQLPRQSPIQFSPRALAADVQRVIVSFALPPQARTRAKIETSDAIAAGQVKEVIEKVLALSSQAKDAVTVKVDVANVLMEASPEKIAKIVAELAAPARASANMQQTTNTLKQIGLAMHNYASVEKHLPPRCLVDSNGKPLLSWLVTILPYLDQQALYNACQLDQAWDSEQNKMLAETFIPNLCVRVNDSTKTRFRAPVFPGSLWHGDGPPKSFQDVIDGTANTIAVIHAPADAAVAWADPTPWQLSEDDPMSDVFGDREQLPVLFLDGSARVFKKDELNNEKLKAMLTIAGQEVIE